MPERKSARGWAAATVGFVLVLIGIGGLVAVMFTTTPTALPINYTTIGLGITAGAGLAAFAVGFEQGRPAGA